MLQALKRCASIAGLVLVLASLLVGAAGAVVPIGPLTTPSPAMEPPGVPALLSPPDGSYVTTMTPRLSWQSVAGATSYWLQVSPDLRFWTAVIDRSGMTDTSYEVPLTPSAPLLQESSIYYWRVSATGPGGSSDWSPGWRFLTPPVPQPQLVTVNRAPLSPALKSPGDQQTVRDTTPRLEWQEPAFTDSSLRYNLQLAKDAEFKVLVTDQTALTGTRYDVPALEANTTYYWRVSGTNANGTSGWSEAWAFATPTKAPAPSTGNTPLPPVLKSPGDGSALTGRTARLEWELSTGAAAYTVQLARDALFYNLTMSRDAVTANFSETITLDWTTTYFWRVSASNSAGASAWSAVRTFTTPAPSVPSPVPPSPPRPPATSASPGPPAPVSPANGSTVAGNTSQLEWSESARALSYNVQLATDPGFGRPIIDRGGMTTRSLPTGPLDWATVFYWRVSASNTSGTSEWSAVSTFTTAAQPSPPPIRPWFSWFGCSGP